MDIKKNISKDRTGLVGSPKKGGAGGKGTWGVGGLGDLVKANTDSRDPNYESGDEEVAHDYIKVSPIEEMIKQFLMECDIGLVADNIKEADGSIIVRDFVRKVMFASMERQPFEREYTSRLLSELCGEVFTSQDVSDGFHSALEKVDDAILDIPGASEMLGKFIARAIMDEIIPPAFIKTASVGETGSVSKEAKEALGTASSLINDPHRSRKLEHIWGPGDFTSVKRMKEEVSALLREYLVNGDKQEADRSVRHLNAPSFHFQLVRQALRTALAGSDSERKSILELLSFFSKTGLISSNHISQGFKACSDLLPDIKLDIPNATTLFSDIVKDAQSQGWLSVDYK